jgi:SAM-dependent methyltransferase
MSQPQTKLSTIRLDSTSDAWDLEYTTHKVIPSSTRMLPSKALVLFSELLGIQEATRVLDAGCGTGRNSIYLATKGCEVHALDFSRVALERLNTAAIQAGTRDKIFSYEHELQSPFPFSSNSFDLALDSYVLCHFTDSILKSSYLAELHRTLKPSGILFSSLFSMDDEYYMEMPGAEDGIVIDQNNELTKQLYTEEEARNLFSVNFDVLYFVKFQFTDIVLQQPYKRSLLVFVLQKV